MGVLHEEEKWVQSQFWPVNDHRTTYAAHPVIIPSCLSLLPPLCPPLCLIETPPIPATTPRRSTWSPSAHVRVAGRSAVTSSRTTASIRCWLLKPLAALANWALDLKAGVFEDRSDLRRLKIMDVAKKPPRMCPGRVGHARQGDIQLLIADRPSTL